MIERFPGLADRTYLNSCSYGLSPVGARAVYARWQAVMERFEDAAFGELYGELEAFRDRLNRFVGGDAGSVWVDQSSSALLARIGTSVLPMGDALSVSVMVCGGTLCMKKGGSLRGRPFVKPWVKADQRE